MTFHKSDRSEYVQCGQQLHDENFERLFNAHLLDGSLQKKRDEQIRRTAKSELRHELEDRFKAKLRHFAQARERGGSNHRSWHRVRDGKSFSRDRHGYESRPTSKDFRGGERKSPPEDATKKP